MAAARIPGAVGDQCARYVNRCAHQSLPLNYLPDRFLTHDGSMILATAHGAIFEKSTGFCVSGPCAGRSLAASRCAWSMSTCCLKMRSM